MRKRTEWFKKSDPNKRLYYQIPVEPMQVDKLVFDTLVARFGEKKTLRLIEEYSRGYSLMNSFYDFINPGNNLTQEEVNMAIDKYIQDGTYLYFEQLDEDVSILEDLGIKREVE